MIIKQLKLILALFITFGFAQAQSILVVGDSIGAGFGINPKDSWVNLLNEKLKAEGYQYEMVNRSISGDTTTNGLNRLPRLLEQVKPEITIIELGGNDGLRATSATRIAENLSAMIELAKASNSKVLLVGIQLPPNYGDAYLERFLAIYPELGEKHQIAVLPSIVEKVGGNNDLMQNDGIHPNKEAQPIIVESVWKKIKPLLSH
jgi:acyl-CoA thioesterase-1